MVLSLGVLGLGSACDEPASGTGLADDQLSERDLVVAPLFPADDLYAGEFGQIITGNVLDNDEAGEGFYDPLAVAVLQPRYGSLTGLGGSIYGGVTPWGVFEYTPAPGFVGLDAFAYQVFNSGEPSQVVTVFVAVGDMQVASAAEPTLVLGAASAANRTPVTAGTNFQAAGQYWRVLPAPDGRAQGLRTLASGAGGQIKVMETWQPDAAGTEVTVFKQNGKAWQDFSFISDHDSSFTIVSDYTDYRIELSEPDAFIPTVSAVPGDNAFTRWIFHAPGQPPPPLVYADAFTTALGTNVTGNVGSNDVGTGVDYLALLATAPAHGTLVGIAAELYGGIAPWGTFEYQPDPGFEGTDSFGYYALTSGDGAPSAVATVTITVGGP